MATNQPMNQSNLSQNLTWQDPEGLALLGIPLGKEVQQLALAFASEQKDVKTGKQVFLNTLSVIAVHKCLKMFGFDSYLESGDCWNKVKRSLFNVADLLVADWGRIECFPILPKQENLELEPGLLDERKGCIGVKFHEHFNYVEMFGFKRFDRNIKSELEKTLTLKVKELQVFEDIFHHLPCISKTTLEQWNNQDFAKYDNNYWQSPESLGFQPLSAFASNTRPIFRGRNINFETLSGSHTIRLLIGYDSQRNFQFGVHPQSNHHQLPDNLTITLRDHEGFWNYKGLTIEELDIRKLPEHGLRFPLEKGYSFQIELCLDDEKKIEKFTV